MEGEWEENGALVVFRSFQERLGRFANAGYMITKLRPVCMQALHIRIRKIASVVVVMGYTYIHF